MRCRRRLILLPLLTVGLMGLATTASAATFTVNSTSDTGLTVPSSPTCPPICTLREAVQAADNTPGTSTIVLPAGTYTLTIPNTASAADNPATGDLDVNNGVQLTITGAGASSTTIDANHIDRAFAVHSNAGLSLSGVTLENGSQPDTAPSDDSTASGDGGAIYNDGSLLVDSSVLTDNSADTYGGVVYADTAASSSSILNSTVRGNSATGGAGGALAAMSGSVTLTDDAMTHNSAADYGGAILSIQAGHTGGQVTITHSTISDNVVGGDGAGALTLFDAGPATITNSTIDDNTSEGTGGAIDDDNSGALAINGSDLSGDSTISSDGGAIYATDTAPVSITASTFDGDSSSQGGAVDLADTDLAVSASVFDGDQAGNGGALYIDGSSATGTESVSRSTFSDDDATDDAGGAIDDDAGNLVLSASTFSDNDASSEGGALAYNSGDGLEMTNDTLDGNEAYAGGGIWLPAAATTGTVTLLNDTVAHNAASVGGGIDDAGLANTIENTIVVDNMSSTDARGGGDCHGSATTDNAGAADAGGNIDSDGTCFSASVYGDRTNASLDLGAPSTNGGPTETDALPAGSPAVGTAISAACPATDQRGVPRPGACDAGAYQTANATVGISESGPSTAAVGSPVTYALTVTNTGPAPATAVRVIDTLPPGTTYFGSTSSQGGCSGTTTVTCSLGTLDSSHTGTTTTATVSVTLIPSTAVSIINTAEVDDSEASTASASASTNVDTDTDTLTTAAPTPPALTTTTSPGLSPQPTAVHVAPVVLTGVASQIASTSAKLSAIINPAGESTRYSMQVGTGKQHQATTKSGTLAARTTATGVVISARHLKAGRTYHFRIVAKNATGTSYGQEVTFRTRKAARARPGPRVRGGRHTEFTPNGTS